MRGKPREVLWAYPNHPKFAIYVDLRPIPEQRYPQSFMDPPHGPDMTLSIRSPAFSTDVHENAAVPVKLPRDQAIQGSWWDVHCSSMGSKAKRMTSGALEVSGLSFESDELVGGMDLGLCSSRPSPCNSVFSTGSGASLMTGISEEGPPMSLCLGLTRNSSHGFENACANASFMSGGVPSRTSVDNGMHLFATSNSEAGNGTNVLLGLGPSHHQLFENKSKNKLKRGFNANDDNLIGSDLGMQLQLSLSNSSTVVSDDDHVSHISLGQGKGSTYPDAGNGSVCIELNLTADDEGSTSARTVKAGGYIPSLLMGRRLDSVPVFQREGEQEQSDKKRNHVHQTDNEQPGLGCTKKVRKLDDLSVSIKTLSGNTITSGPSSVVDRTPRTCKFRGCGKGARGASGLCITHGGGRRCQRQGCNKGAEGRTVYCKSHGGGRRCQSLGCTKSAEGKTDYCIGHGGGRRCSQDGCTKAARGRSGLCIRHGGGKRCQKEGCTKSAEGYSGLCISHGGGRRCQAEGCSKGAQGSTIFCKAHGGGKRCMIQGCSKGAEGSTPLCKGHGGGKRCMFDGGGICTKSVHGGTSFCVAHGGGKRCAVDGCTKSARGKTFFCVKHGGGKRCKFNNCTKSAQGSTDFCKAHGGGKRCSWGQKGSPYAEFVNDKTGELLKASCERFARGKIGLCAAHTALVQDRRVHGASTIGSALPAGIGPGLFRGLVTGLTTKKNHRTSVSDKSTQSTAGRDDCGSDGCEHGRIINGLTGGGNSDVAASDACNRSIVGGSEEYMSESGGLHSSKADGVNGGPSENQVVHVQDKSQHAHRFPEDSVGYNMGLMFAGNDLVITPNQNQCSKMMNSGSMIPNIRVAELWAGASRPIQCKANRIMCRSAGSFSSPSFLAAVHNVEAPAVRNCLVREGTMVRRALLPPQVLVPPSMQKGQFLPSHGKGHVKHTAVSNVGETDIANTSLSAMCEGKVRSGREERVHGGSFLAMLSGFNFRDIS